MASIKFYIKTKGNPSNLYIRFIHGRGIDCYAKTNILIDPKLWSDKKEDLKPLVDNETKELYRNQIDGVKKEITKCFNRDFSNGDLINSKWLSKVIENYYKRPTDENDYRIFLIPFIEKFAEESENRINLKTGKKISYRTIQKYRTTIKQIKEFEEKQNSRLKLTDITLEFHKKYTTYLKLELRYSNTMIEKIISQIKGFVLEAKESGFEVSKDIESKKFTFQRDEPLDTFLTEKEIDLIFNLDLSDNESLSNARDWIIFGVWTGLRVSDLNRINQFQLSKNTIIISETDKTSASVEIPLHNQVKATLEKRGGELPRVISVQKLNEYIKRVCELAGITEIILGNLKNPETNRKEKGYYEKFRLISTHSFRRSFASNHYGKLDNLTIMSITTHRSHSQFMKYIKTTQKDYVDRLSKYWEEKEELKKSESKMKIIS